MFKNVTQPLIWVEYPIMFRKNQGQEMMEMHIARTRNSALGYSEYSSAILIWQKFTKYNFGKVYVFWCLTI